MAFQIWDGLMTDVFRQTRPVKVLTCIAAAP